MKVMTRSRTLVLTAALVALSMPALAQTTPRPAQTQPGATAAPAAAGITPPPGYVIGPDDVIEVIFWKDEQSSSKDVPVRPDGKVSLTLLNEMQAAGKTPEQFRLDVTKAAEKYLTDPVVSVNIKQINSRRVYITGMVAKPAAYGLGQPMTVLQLISLAGGLQEYAKSKEITIIRNGVATPFRFNYEDVRKGKNLKQNIELQPGDQVIVP